MESLRKMREAMAGKFETFQKRSVSPTIPRADLEIIVKQQILKSKGLAPDDLL